MLNCLLLGTEVPTPVCPKLKLSSWHSFEASKYTENLKGINFACSQNRNSYVDWNQPCSPVSVPHNSGRFCALVTLNKSVAQLVAWFASLPLNLNVETVWVVGPVMTNVLKSSLIYMIRKCRIWLNLTKPCHMHLFQTWQMLLEQGQILLRQAPAFNADASK